MCVGAREHARVDYNNNTASITVLFPVGSCDSPKIVVHGFKEKPEVGFVQSQFKVGQGDALCGHTDPDQVGGVLVLQVVDDPGLIRHAAPHPC